MLFMVTRSPKKKYRAGLSVVVVFIEAPTAAAARKMADAMVELTTIRGEYSALVAMLVEIGQPFYF